MTNEEAIMYLQDIKKGKYQQYPLEQYQALELAIKALVTVDSLHDMKDNAYKLYLAEDGKSDYSYGRKQVIGTFHSDLEQLLEDFGG